jgi:hypothetical protein
MNVITEINQSAISSAINKGDNDLPYITVIGSADFVPNPTIVTSADFKCGALCNELEYARLVAGYYVGSMNPAQATGNELNSIINAFINLPRNGATETDSMYLDRFLAIVAQNSFPNRCTPGAILNALSYFINIGSIQIVEPFNTNNLYFEVRFSGTQAITSTLTFDNDFIGFLNNNYIGGVNSGVIITYIYNIIQRIKAAGVSFVVYTVSLNSITSTTYFKIGSRQFSVFSKCDFLNVRSITNTISAYFT